MAETDISLCFGDHSVEPVFYPISGFPRFLLDEENRLTSKTRLSFSFSRNRTPTTAHRRDSWSIPTLDATEDLIEQYEDPSYRYPGAATQDDISEISQRLSPPSLSSGDKSYDCVSVNRQKNSNNAFLSPSW